VLENYDTDDFRQALAGTKKATKKVTPKKDSKVIKKDTPKKAKPKKR
jgi:hypothetical protein